MYDFEKMGIESSPTVHSCGIMTARQFIRTKLTVGEASSVLDEAMKHFGWRAGACMRRFSCLATRLYLYFHPSIHQHTHIPCHTGLRYVERMGARPEHRLSIRHFNKVVRACCRDQGLRSLRSVLRVRACLGLFGVCVWNCGLPRKELWSHPNVTTTRVSISVDGRWWRRWRGKGSPPTTRPSSWG